MDSLKVFAAKVKSSPQIIRKTFASSAYDSYAKVSGEDKLKGKGKYCEMKKLFSLYCWNVPFILEYWKSTHKAV